MTLVRWDAVKLCEELLLKPLEKKFRGILCDEPIILHLVKENLKKFYTFPVVLDQKNALFEAIDGLSTGGLFGEPPPALVLLSEKMTKKQWAEESAGIRRLPQKLEVPFIVMAPVALRSVIDDEAFGVCYAPQLVDVSKILPLLAKRYERFKKHSNLEIHELVGQLIDVYHSDLFSADMHLKRMEQSNMSFSDCLNTHTEVTAFDVVDALAYAQFLQVELRIQQCAASGVEASSILAAILFYLKQLLNFKSNLMEFNDPKRAFEAAQIPFPAQKKILAGHEHIKTEHILSFLLMSPKLEMILRTQRKGYLLLATELMGFSKGIR